MRSDDLLILNYERLSARTTELYGKMAESAAFRALFLKDPAGTISRMLLPDDDQPPPSQIRQANRLLFALLSNDGFMEWAAGFQKRMQSRVGAIQEVDDDGERHQLAAATLDRTAVYREIVDAMVTHLDAEILASILVGVPADAREGLASRLPDRPMPVVVLDYPVIIIAQSDTQVAFVMEGRLTEGVSRVDLQRAATFLAEELPARAREVRASGALTDIDSMLGGPGK